MILPQWLDHTTWGSKRWLTAIHRKSLSMPMRLAVEKKVIAPKSEVLDFGCGRGADVLHLRQKGYKAFGYDPYYCDVSAELETTQVVTCFYVLNVIENPSERLEVLQFLWALTGDVLIIAVRSDGIGQSSSKLGTYQQYYTRATFGELIHTALPKVEIKFLSTGVAVIGK